MSDYRGTSYDHGESDGGEGLRPEAREAADAWQRRFGREGHEGSYAEHDETYGAFRQRHLAELDKDYEAWCQEREQGFHRDFGEWRSKRREVSNQPGSADLVASDQASDQLVNSPGERARGSASPSRRRSR